MTHDQAVALIRDAVTASSAHSAGPPAWADFGAGEGTFSRALAELLGPDATVIAVDRSARALRRLARSADRLRADGGRASIVTAPGDFRRLGSIPPIAAARLAGALFANALHFVPRPESVLAATAARLDEGGTIVVVEYQDRPASPWVPHPLPLHRLRQCAREAGLGDPVRTATTRSAYGGLIYCAGIPAEPR
jgi:SAM-dependent methyltransferase